MTPDDALLEIKRVFDAPPERVFNAWIDRDEWQSWIGPEGIDCELPLFEPRVGGSYKLIMKLPDGSRIFIVGTFKSINPNKSLSFSWRGEGGENDSLVTITLRDLGGKTELTLRHEGLLMVENRDRHGQGWNSALNKLEKYLASHLPGTSQP